MKKKLVSGVLAFTTAALLTQPVNVLANDIGGMESQKKKIQEQRSSVENSLGQKNSEMEHLETESQNVASSLEQVSKQIKETNKKLEAEQVKITIEQKKAKQLKSEIADLKDEIKQRKGVLDKRARAIQTNGNGQGYLNVLLQAEDFSDFVGRANIVKQIVNADQEIMKKQKKDQALLKEKQDASLKKLAELNQLATQIAVTKNNLVSQKAEQDDLLLALATKKDKTNKEKAILETERANLSAEEQKVAANLTAAYAEEQRKKEEAAKKRLAEAKRQQALAAAEARAKTVTRKAETTTRGNSVAKSEATAPVESAASSASSASAPSSSGSMFIKPAAGILTSGFSERTNPVTGQYESHKGQDISTGGTVPVSAAASGTVVFAGYGAPGSGYGGYGYVVEIDHGNGYQTLYAHMRAGSLNVVAGQRVMQGQNIGIMGSTGQSTGQHLHFEIHQNGVPINPAPYL
ncbi:murein hydrolase activator EnvC family protein [Listeria fleischmannii]|uniref:Peptidoglycan DD-metalloendopeptidase family protein n=1 Tax=Listeria fleischmannii TaxID=1069827 RepID=A0A841YE14_9LIST|nr:peptidoglycan DD-metalloendopeptidase family protein [Listeria fleischmannii]MBC1398506.1 peptidoglycan DD-metalloendopeptidase family protein [Listeria fleischmannii]MBC1426567.1 peptidoglycan DD-metalloendopeptidase family protein [Listeria fleischmannii]STY46518.1 Peptidoglycan DL-endopeptidase CwlO precursor [Listeria fleischmannii subsp. coloradonensis]